MDVTVIDQMGYAFVPLLFTMGVIGNSLTIIVMLSASFRELPVSKMLIAMSVSDTVVNLVFPFNKPFVRQLIGTDIRALSSGGCKLFFWTYRFAKTTSSWMVVLISIERFIAVWLPLKAKFINTKRNVYVAMASLYAVFAVFFGYWTSWADRVVDGACIINSRPADDEQLLESFLVSGLFLYSVVPAAVLLIVNVLIIYRLVKIRRKTSPVAGDAPPSGSAGQPPASNAVCVRSTTTSRTTIMLLSAAISFVVLVTPNTVAHVVSYARREDMFESTDPVMVYIREFGQTLEQLNHSVNFLLYVLCSKRFRNRVVGMFKRQKNSKVSALGASLAHTAALSK